MEELKEILPFISSGGSVGLLFFCYLLFKEWKELKARMTGLEMKIVRLITALRITNPKLGTVLDHQADGPDSSSRH